MKNINRIQDKKTGSTYLANHQVLIQNLGQDLEAEKPTSVLAPVKNKASKVATWGADNRYPMQVVKASKSSSIVAPTINWLLRAIYGGGLQYGKLDGTEFKPENGNQEIDKFIRDANVPRLLQGLALDFYYFFNTFPELILSKDRSKIVNIQRQKAIHCRYQVKEAGDLYPANCFISGSWDKERTEKVENDPATARIPVINPDVEPVETVKNDPNKALKYIYPASYPEVANDYYTTAPWHSVIKGGWLDVSNEIPAFKKAIFENQMAIKYHIDIPLWYWDWRFPGFDGENSQKKNELIRQVHDELTDMLTKSKNAGKSILTHSKEEGVGGNYRGIQINTLDTRFGDKLYIEDSAEASNHILFALGVDPTLIGNAPGNKMGAGSGSDKLVAFNIFKALQKINIEVLLEPLHYIRDFNGWDPELTFRLHHPVISRMDEQPPLPKTATT